MRRFAPPKMWAPRPVLNTAAAAPPPPLGNIAALLLKTDVRLPHSATEACFHTETDRPAPPRHVISDMKYTYTYIYTRWSSVGFIRQS